MAPRVLIVEDDGDIRQMLREVLEMSGLEGVGLGHPDLVLDVARHQRPDLVLVDMMLPKRSGIEVAENLQANGFAGVPMIAMSASTVMGDLARHTELFADVLLKPFDIDRLLRAIKTAVTDRTPIRESEVRPGSDEARF